MELKKNERGSPLFDSEILMVLVIIPFLKPASLEFILPFLDNVFDALKLVSFAVILFMYIRNGSVSKIILSLTAYEALLFISTAVNKGDYWKFAVLAGTVIGFSMLTELAVKNNAEVYFKTVLDIYLPFTVLNLLSILLLPSGLAVESYYGNIYYFLGIRNGMPAIFIPVMVCAIIYSAYSGKKLTAKAFLLSAVIIVTVLVTWSATGVAGLMIFIFLAVFVYRTKLAPVFNSLFLSAVYAAMFLLIIIFRMQHYFSFIIEDLLHKSINFTGRTDIWDIAMRLIKNSPLLGYGVYEGQGLIFYRGIYYYAHNAVLEVLLRGGVSAFIFFAAVWVIAIAALYKNRNSHISEIITFGVFTLLIMMLMETYTSQVWPYAAAVIASCAADIEEQVSACGKNDSKAEKTVSLRMRYIMYRLNRR